MATAPGSLVQLEFPFMEPNPEYPTELHNIRKNRAEIGSVVNTIRRGNKWSNVPIGHEIVLTQGPSHDWVGIGKVVRVRHEKFQNLQLESIALSNHAGPLTYAELLRAMRDAYGEGFREDEYVVVLWYTRIR